MSKQILVTGGAGFIGSHLIHALVRPWNSVWSIDNYTTGNMRNEVEGCEYLEKDLIYESTLHDHKFDIIYHLAARPRIQPSLLDPEYTMTNNIMSTLNVLKYARKTGCKVIFASSSSVGGNRFANPYTLSKSMCEDLCREYHTIYELDISIARFYNVYGPRMIGDSEFGTVLGVWLERYKKSKPLKITGDGTQRRDFTHVDDIVAGLIEMSGDVPYYRPVELGRGENYSLNELVDLFPNAKKEYVDRPSGEMAHTLCKDRNPFLDWKPQRNVKDFILESIKES
mgnify:CR=1 FL=1